MSTSERIGRHLVVATEERSCDTHGAYTAKKWGLDPPPKPIFGKPIPTFLAPFWGNCPKCDKAMQEEADRRDAEIRGCLTQKQKLANIRVMAAGIPSRFAESTVWNWLHPMDAQRKVWDWARLYAATFELSLESGRSGIFCGAPGCGKTHLAIGLLRHVIERGGSGAYTTVMDMLRRIKATFRNKTDESETDVIKELSTCDILVVDEVGRALDSTYETAQLFNVLDKRYQGLKPTILVSNLPVQKLKDFLGESVVDRMRENGGAMLTFDWASHRNSKRPDR